jgi:hypothetical protein
VNNVEVKFNCLCPKIYVADLSSPLYLFTILILFIKFLLEMKAFSVKRVARDGNCLLRSLAILLEKD